MTLSDEDPQNELEEYKYDPLTTLDSLRILRLRPATDEQEGIDCEIIELPLLKESSHHVNDTQSMNHEVRDRDQPSSGESQDSDGATGHVVLPDEPESGDEEAVPESTDQPGNGTRGFHSCEIPKQQGDYKSDMYEAVSWCWGREPQNEILRVHKRNVVYAFYVSRNLRTALWALRKDNEVRQLWIDAICIDQKNTKERNQQVPRMDKIYGKATNVCIWLGEGNDESKLAMKFIKERVLKIWDFDKLIENRDMAKQWAALIRLMKRPWFSRRWVVQEIALSPRGGTLYCGKEQVSWQDFADAVSLFVEVESATHRLSDVMKLDQSFGNIPEFFGDVSSLGAALLVDATSNLFRNAKMTGERTPLSTLEYLVSRLSVFEAAQPRDTIYALLAIAKDTVPQTDRDPTAPQASNPEKVAMSLAPKKGFEIQPYKVDYKLPVIDVYQEFIEFAIQNADPTKALDIICRPWAPTVMKSHDDPLFNDDPSGKVKQRAEGVASHKRKREEEESAEREDSEVPMPSWIPGLNRATSEMEEHPFAGLRMERQNADPLVGMPEPGYRIYSAAETRKVDPKKLRFLKWDTLRKEGTSYPEYSMFVQGFILTEVSSVEQVASNGNIPYRWLAAGGWTDTGANPPEMFWRTLVADRGSGGRNPPSYFPRACKESMKFKAKTRSKIGGNLDCKRMINEGHCTIVAEFLRRVQEVIWNRQLMKTKDGRLGLVRDDVSPGFKVCILYGCSVPVILEEIAKTSKELKAERRDRYKQWQKELERVVGICKARYKMKLLRRAKTSQPQLEEAQVDGQSHGGAEHSSIDRHPGADEQLGNGNSVIVEQMRPVLRRKTIEEVHKELEVGKEHFQMRKARERNRQPPLSPYYRLVGECYVHGMMNGEAIGLQNRNNIPEKTFELR